METIEFDPKWVKRKVLESLEIKDEPLEELAEHIEIKDEPSEEGAGQVDESKFYISDQVM